MRKSGIAVLVALVLLFGGTFGFYLFRQHMTAKYFSTFTPPPATVSAAHVKAQPFKPKLLAVGSLKSVNGVDISPEVTGKVVKIYFRSGQHIQAGEPLIQLDDTVDRQLVKQDTSALHLAKLNFDRQKDLYQKRASAKMALDEARANWEQLQAGLNSTQATLAKKRVLAPFSGKLGIRQVNLGEYLQPGQAIVTLQSTHPLYVDFSLPEQNLNQLQLLQPITLHLDAHPKQEFHGKIIALDSKVDQSTRTVTLRAQIPNEKERLYPGEFANVSVSLPERQQVIIVPNTAIAYSLYGDSVYVLHPADSKAKKNKASQPPQWTVEQRFIKLGQRQDDVVIVTSGLKTGEYIVTSGQLKIHPGVRVVIDKKVAF